MKILNIFDILYQFFKKIFFILRHKVNGLYKKVFFENKMNQKVLQNNKDSFAAFVDLNRQSPNFNLLDYFLYIKEIARDKNLFLIILPLEKFENPKLPERDNVFFDLRLKSILTPLIDLVFKNNVTVIFAEDRKKIEFFFNFSASQKFPSDASYFKINDTFILTRKLFEKMQKDNKRCLIDRNIYLEQFFEKKFCQINFNKLIVISLRLSSYNKVATSNKNLWLEFKKWLISKNYEVIILTDYENLEQATELNKDKPELINLSTLCSIDLVFRKILQDKSLMNFATGSGINQLLYFSESRYIVVKFSCDHLKNSKGSGTLNSIIEQQNLSLGEQIPFSNKNQKIFWGLESENIDLLKKEFLDFEQKYKNQ